MRRLALCVALAATLALSGTALAARETAKIGALQPAWTLGVYAGYYGPPDYLAVSPGVPAVYLGREAGIIKAGLTVDPDGHYWDEGLFAFKPGLTINQFAAGPLTYDVVNQYGTNPVWITFEIDTGAVGDRSDNLTFQYVPAPYGSAGYVTVNAGTAATWYQWADNSGTLTGSARTLASVASQYPGVQVVRTYLRLGMGDSYGPGPNGTQAWVDKVTIGNLTYDFVTRGQGYTQKDWSTNPGHHGFKAP